MQIVMKKLLIEGIRACIDGIFVFGWMSVSALLLAFDVNIIWVIRIRWGVIVLSIIWILLWEQLFKVSLNDEYAITIITVENNQRDKKHIFMHIPFVLLLCFFQLVGLYGYILMHFVFILIDPKHKTLMERIDEAIENRNKMKGILAKQSDNIL